MKKLILSILLIISMPANALVLETILNPDGFFADKKICYFVGSFDPLHLGHEDIATHAVQEGICDYTIIYPSWGGDNYKKRADINLRLEMLYATFKNHPNVIMTFLPPKKLQEFLTKPSDKTYLDKKLVVPAFDNSNFIGVIGSDVALQLIEKIDDPEEDLKRQTHLSYFMRGIEVPQKYAQHSMGGIMAIPIDSFILALREEQDLNPICSAFTERPIIKVIKSAENQKISSSLVKKNMKNKKNFKKMLNPDVAEIIVKNRLYP